MTSNQANTRDTRLLVLMRHAKSDWSDPSLADHDRPLNHRGRLAAPMMADWLAEVEAIPDLILSSTAERTRETVARMTDQWKAQPQIAFRDQLYLAHPETILNTAASDGRECSRLMLVAHNPGMASLVSTLAGESIDMPTAAIAVFEAEIPSWSELRLGCPIRMLHFMRPKAL